MHFVDIHCHCLPNLDDGPASMDEALALCRSLVADNVSTVVATPHQLGRRERPAGGEVVRRAASALNGELAKHGIDLQVLPGAEVRVDERIGELLARDEILTLADTGRYVLLELPWDTLIDIGPLLLQFSRQGLHVILAHPERNGPLLRDPRVLRRWQACGLGLQVTAASLTGDWGRRVKRAAWDLVRHGQRVCLATDAHDDSRQGRMTAAYHALAARLGSDLAHRLCVENPTCIVRGERLTRLCAEPTWVS
jgi:tyrosine-protein phosphatase YwqE